MKEFLDCNHSWTDETIDEEGKETCEYCGASKPCPFQEFADLIMEDVKAGKINLINTKEGRLKIQCKKI